MWTSAPRARNVEERQKHTWNIEKGKQGIKGLPAVYCENENECETLVVEMLDSISNIKAELYYCVLEDYDIITRYTRITNNGDATVYIDAAASAAVGAWKKCYAANKPAPFLLLSFVGAPITQTLYGMILMFIMLGKVGNAAPGAGVPPNPR